MSPAFFEETIKRSPTFFEEIMRKSPIAREIFMETAEKNGWLKYKIEYNLEAEKKVYGEEQRGEERVEIAINLLKMGMSKEQVSLATKLDIGEILAIETNI